MTSQVVDPGSIITYRTWWPTSVLLPDKSILHRCRVYATSIGLMIYTRRPQVATQQFGALTVDWVAPIDWALTPEPRRAQLPGAAVDIHTSAGLVVLTPTGGCGCGSTLKAWRPGFSTNVAKWPVTS